MTVRLLRLADVPAAMELSARAGWNQTAADWSRMIELEPRGCFGMDCDGRLVATTTLICYGEELAWIGMVLTDRDYQRRGFARRLFAAAVDEARGRGVRCVKLDATDQGHDLYASFGFVDEQPIERWHRLQPVVKWHRLQPVEGRAESPPQAEGLPHMLVLDRETFGVDRSKLLLTLGEALVEEGGFCMIRPGARAAYLGPCVARTPEIAARLIAAALSEGPWFQDLLPSNAAARALATSFGFEPVRHLLRMRLGPAIRTRDDWMFAIAGFEAG
jgi:GNAT superfamily N-acetyltransferase